MPLDRRNFLKGLFGAIGAAAVLDADELLWIPGARVISIPRIVALPAAKTLDGLTDGERYLCAAMGISELGYMLRREVLHRNNGLPAGYFRTEHHWSTPLVGASADDYVTVVKTLFPGVNGEKAAFPS